MTPTLPVSDALIAFYPARDLAAARRFYGGLLELELARDQGSCLIFRVAPGGLLGFCRHDAPPPSHRGLILTLVTDAVDALHARLAAAGVAIETPPAVDERYRIYHFFARDPAGYRLEVQRFLDPLG